MFNDFLTIADDDALAFDEHKGVGGAEVDGDILRKQHNDSP